MLTWYIRRSSDGGVVSFTWGLTGTDHTVPNDYDGDGKTDIAVWRNTDGVFYILSSLTGDVIIRSWGLPNDFPVAAYDTH